MKRLVHNIRILFTLTAVLTSALVMPVICRAEEVTDKSDMIAGEDERAASNPVGEEGMIPVYAEDVRDGTYEIEVESSSSMFRIVKAELTVDDGNMTATVTLGGKGYLKLFMGTGEQAVEANEEEYAEYAEDPEGAYTYRIPVEALNQELACTGFSKRKEKWYDHQILFRADTLPKDAVLKNLTSAQLDVKDGNYRMEAELAGGSGKASIASPVKITVAEKKGTAFLEWSSPNYDYMIVNGEKYFPVNGEGNSVFEIPVLVLDQEMTVIADTTAMSKPHEVEYTLTFHSDTLKKEQNVMLTAVLTVAAAGMVSVLCFVLYRRGRKRKVFFCVFCLLCGLTLYGCKIGGKEPEGSRDISSQLTYKSSMTLDYATEFSVDYYEDGYALITVSDGGRFLVVPKECAVPKDLGEDIVVLKQPVTNIYLAATAVMDMFRELDSLDAIRLSGQRAEGWYLEEASAAMEEGRILYAGKYNTPDYELILSEGCSLAIENTMILHSPEVAEKLQEFQIPVFVDHSSYEKHPLGRVEWIKLYGVLLGKEEKAAEVFQKQDDILKRVTEEIKDEGKEEKTVAFFYITANGSVNVRKASDYIPAMIALAGGRYVFDDPGSGNDHKSSMNMQMEEFYKEAGEADYLIYNSNIDGEMRSLDDLLKKDEIFKDFKAVKEGKVFCAASDFYQQSVSVGVFIEDIRKMLSDDAVRQKEMQYLYALKPEEQK